MNKTLITLSIVAASLCSALPAPAESDAIKTACKVPLDAASMATGTVIGTPVAIVRKTGSQYVDCLKEFRKDSNSYKFWGAVMSLPVAATSGLVKGAVYGPKNAIVHSVAKPFGKDAFSLGPLENSNAGSASKPAAAQPVSDKPEAQPWGSPR